MGHTKGTKEWACKNINFSKGCSNNCRYCYARRMAHRFGWKKDDDWHKMVNREQMGKKKFRKVNGTIMTPSSHDLTPTNVGLAKKVLTSLLKAGNRLLIVSKPNPSVIQEICEQILDFQNLVLWRFTIGTLDNILAKYWEPGAPSIIKRMSILKKLFDEGWETSVSIEPFLDQHVIPLIDKIAPYVTNTIWIGPMNKIHVPKELWSEEMSDLYSGESLYELKTEIDYLENPKIRYKDHFLTKIERFKKSSGCSKKEEIIPLLRG